VDWLEDALGFEERLRIGDTHRAQMRVGADGAIVVADVGSDRVAPERSGQDTSDQRFACPTSTRRSPALGIGEPASSRT